MEPTENQVTQNSPIENKQTPNTAVKSDIPGWARILIILPLFLIVVGGFEFLGAIASGLSFSDFSEEQTLLQMLISQAFNLIGTILLLLFMMKRIDREPFVNLGFQTKGRRPDLLIGIIAGFIFMVGGFAILQASGYITVKDMEFDFVNFALLLLLFIFVAFAEELLLRGYVLKNLMLSINKYAALILSSLLFSSMHGLNPNFSWFSFFSLFLAGVALGITYIYTNNLWFPIAFHFSWNFFQSVMGFNVSGLDLYSVVETTPSMAHPKISGGTFGLEGSVLALLFEATVIVCAIFYYRKKEKNMIS